MILKYGLIPAAGKGTRARPYSHMIPKSMLEINGVPNLERNLILMRDELKIDNIIIVIGHLGKIIKDYFGDGSNFNVKINYIENKHLDRGLAYSIYLGGNFIDDNFCVILSDECYTNSNHKELLNLQMSDIFGICTSMHTDDRELIKKNYSIEIDGERITRLIEKPSIIKNDILGCGTFIFNPCLFKKLESEFKNNHYVEFVNFLNKQCEQNQIINMFNLKGNYVNINDRDSLHIAKYHERSDTFDKQSISLLIYSEGNEQNLAFTINRYKLIPEIDNLYLIVPYENSFKDYINNLDIEIIECPREINKYGEKQKYAMEYAKGDIFILCDADYSFPNRDIYKLLAYIREADMVVGTRTTRQLIEQGSNMRGLVRIANIILAKSLELLWWNFEARFTDVQSIFRAIWKKNFDRVKDNLTCKGEGFGAEMIIDVLCDRGRIIEIPVNYNNRPNSAYRKYQNYKTFFSVLFTIIYKKINFILKLS